MPATEALEPGDAPVVLRPGLARSALPAVLCVVCLAISVVAALSAPVAWIGVAFFGVGAVFIGLGLLPAASGLALAPEGFTVRSLFRGGFTRWGDVTGFDVGRMPGRGGIVTIGYRPGAPYVAGRRVAEKLGGADGVLPETYGLDAGELAALLERWRAAQSAPPAGS